ncbi:hypothetical protein LTR85_003785 [Meristemomyces frigidus]|nr:hypothetical protein LTR85_003785 [Meristemomyces frigidus]
MDQAPGQFEHQADVALPQKERAEVQQHQQQPEAPIGKKWRAWQLSYEFLATMLMLQLGLLAALAVLIRLSHAGYGFVAVGEKFALGLSINDHESRKTLSETFLWTTIPTLFMALFAMAWGSVVGAYAAEMPFIALGEGGTLQKTVCLDYRRLPSFYNYIVAWRNKHMLLGFCMFFAFLATVALVPLAAHLFQLITPVFTVSGLFPQTSVYSESKLVALIDYQPIIGIVSAVRVYKGNWPSWTDGIYAVSAFDRPVNVTSGANVTQFQVDTIAYSAGLDCQSLNEYSLSRYPADGNTTTITLNASDRGCDIALTAGVSPGNTIYLKTVSNDNCPEGTGYSRISYLAGAYSASSTYLLDSISVISCIPSYAQTSGSVTGPPSFLPFSFQPGLATPLDARPYNWRLFEQQLIALSNIGNNNSPDFTSQFGDLILNMIDAQDAAHKLNPSILISATATAFSSAFAILARTRLYQELPPGQSATGSVVYSQTRLATVAWSAYTSIAIVSVLVILTVNLIVAMRLKRPTLAEEPRGILCAAALLHGSGLQELVGNKQWRQNYEGRFYEWLQKEHNLGTERCELDTDDVIIVNRVVPKAQLA